MKLYNKFIFLLVLLLILIFLNLITGSVNVPLRAFLSFGNEGLYDKILVDIRFPRIISGLVAGAALSVSGLLMQNYFRNPVAGPFILGISSGASLGVALVIMGGIQISAWTGISFFAGKFYLIISAIAGALVVLLALLSVSARIKDSNTLLILGLMFGSLSAAFISMLEFYSGQTALKQYVLWTMGSLQGLEYEELFYLIGCTLPIYYLLLRKSALIDSLLLGVKYSSSIGVDQRKLRSFILLSTAVLAGSITAFCGPISFIGIAVPHIARMIFKTYQTKILIPACILIGMNFLLLCSWFGQYWGEGSILPINILTALLGAPFVIYIVMTKRSI